MATETAIFAAGCFWGVEDAFASLPGVLETEVGYIGGHRDNPTYEDVCSHETGHAEAVKVTFDPSKIGYETLVCAFFTLHDPTQIDGQGPDIGDQYRSAIFTVSDAHTEKAKHIIDEIRKQGVYKDYVRTTVEPAPKFWRAEEYHQKYHQKHGGSCRL